MDRLTLNTQPPKHLHFRNSLLWRRPTAIIQLKVSKSTKLWFAFLYLLGNIRKSKELCLHKTNVINFKTGYCDYSICTVNILKKKKINTIIHAIWIITTLQNYHMCLLPVLVIQDPKKNFMFRHIIAYLLQNSSSKWLTPEDADDHVATVPTFVWLDYKTS